MGKDLILTGWSKNSYLAAAAAALAALKGKADVAGVSMNALAGVLAERAANYSAVYVLGVGLVKNIPSILESLKLLKQKHVKTVWLSGMPVAPEFAAEVCIDGEDPAKRGFDELVDAPSESLVDVVAEYFGTLENDDVRFNRFCQIRYRRRNIFEICVSVLTERLLVGGGAEQKKSRAYRNGDEDRSGVDIAGHIVAEIETRSVGGADHEFKTSRTEIEIAQKNARAHSGERGGESGRHR